MKINFLKKAICFLGVLGFLAVGTAQAQTANVTYYFSDFTSQPAAVRRATLTPLAPAGDFGTSTNLIPSPVSLVTGAAGAVTFSNVVSGYAYSIALFGPYQVTTRTNFFPSSLTGNVNGHDYLGWVVGTASDGSVIQFAYFYPPISTNTSVTIYTVSSSTIQFTGTGSSGTPVSGSVIGSLTNDTTGNAFATATSLSNQIVSATNNALTLATNSFDPTNSAKNATNAFASGELTTATNNLLLTANAGILSATNNALALATNSFDPTNSAKNATNAFASGELTTATNNLLLTANAGILSATNNALTLASNSFNAGILSATNNALALATNSFDPTNSAKNATNAFASGELVTATNNLLVTANAGILSATNNALTLTSNSFNSGILSATNNALTLSSNALATGVNALSNYDKSIYLPVTNGTAQGLTVNSNLALGNNPFATVTPTVVGMTNWSSVDSNANGSYYQVSATLWQNTNAAIYTILTNGASAIVQSNAATLATATGLAGPWTLSGQGTGNTPGSYIGATVNETGVRHTGQANFDNLDTTIFTGNGAGLTNIPPTGISGVAAGYSGIVTNWQNTTYSNRLYYCSGVLTNVTIP